MGINGVLYFTFVQLIMVPRYIMGVAESYPGRPRPYAERELGPHDVNNVPVSRRRKRVCQRQMALYTAATTVTFVALVASLSNVPIYDLLSLYSGLSNKSQVERLRGFSLYSIGQGERKSLLLLPQKVYIFPSLVTRRTLSNRNPPPGVKG